MTAPLWSFQSIQMKIVFSPHAEEKFLLFEERGFPILKEQVLDCMKNPDKIEAGYRGRLVAQKGLDVSHVLRVVFAEGKAGIKRVITFYPGKKERYENKI